MCVDRMLLPACSSSQRSHVCLHKYNGQFIGVQERIVTSVERNKRGSRIHEAFDPRNRCEMAAVPMQIRGVPLQLAPASLWARLRVVDRSARDCTVPTTSSSARRWTDQYRDHLFSRLCWPQSYHNRGFKRTQTGNKPTAFA